MSDRHSSNGSEPGADGVDGQFDNPLSVLVSNIYDLWGGAKEDRGPHVQTALHILSSSGFTLRKQTEVDELTEAIQSLKREKSNSIGTANMRNDHFRTLGERVRRLNTFLQESEGAIKAQQAAVDRLREIVDIYTASLHAETSFWTMRATPRSVTSCNVPSSGRGSTGPNHSASKPQKRSNGPSDFSATR